MGSDVFKFLSPAAMLIDSMGGKKEKKKNASTKGEVTKPAEAPQVSRSLVMADQQPSIFDTETSRTSLFGN